MNAGRMGVEVVPKIYTLELHQDDPAKCTSAKMRKLGLAKSTSANRISREAVVLNPFADVTIMKGDRERAADSGLVVIDCSWVNASEVFRHRLKGFQRKLPALLAGNPTNYAKLGRLSSVEAAAASLYIMNFFDAAERLLSIYKWGETFLTLNKAPLEEYSKAATFEELKKIELAYFPGSAT